MSYPAPQQSDAELLRMFGKEGDQSAFVAVVERYSGLVFSAALRRTRRASIAEEVAQTVFLKLAERAGQLDAKSGIGAWLHKVATREAGAVLRKEQTRQRAMDRYAKELERDAVVAPEAAECRSILDEAIASLRRSDRQAIMERYFEALSFREIGARMGATEDGGRKRVSRALAKLGAAMRRRGAGPVPATVLVTLLGAELSRSAPASIAASVSKTVLASAGSATVSIPHLFTTMKLTHASFGIAVGLAAAVPIAVQWHAHAKIESEPAEPTRSAVASNAGKRTPPAKKEASPQTGETGIDMAAFARDCATIREDGTPHEKIDELRALMFSLGVGELPVVFEFLVSASNRTALRPVIDALFARWAEDDPVEALSEAARQRWGTDTTNARVEIMRTWAAADPEAAVAHAEALPRDTINDIARMCVFRVWAKRDIRSAMEAVGKLDDAERIRSYRNELLRSWVIRDSEGALAWAVSLEDETQRTKTVEAAIENLAQQDPQRAFAHAAMLEDPILRRETLYYAVMQWLNDDKKAVMTAFVDLPREYQDEGIAKNIGMRAQLDRDNATDPVSVAKAWLAEDREQGVRRIGNAIWLTEEERRALLEE